MVSFENFVKLVSPILSEFKVTPSFCFAFKIPDDVTASNTHLYSKVATDYFTHKEYIYLSKCKCEFPKIDF